MKILILTNKMPFPPRDGGAIATLAMARGFRQAGAKVTVLAMNTYKHSYDPAQLPDDLRQDIDWHACYVDTAVKAPELFYNLIFSRKPYNAKRFVSNTYRAKLRALLQEGGFDVVQLEGLYLIPYINEIRKCGGALVSFRAHNVEQEIWRRTVRNQNPGLRRIYSRVLSTRVGRMENSSFDMVDVLVPITERDGNILDFLGNRAPACVAPVGIDPADYAAPAAGAPQESLYFIGSLDWKPNQEGILWFVDQVWGQVLAHRPNARLHVAGRNAPDGFRHKINRRNITFHGQVDDMSAFARAHNVMISPLLSGSGMRVKLVEAMAMGKPIVSTYIGAEGIPAGNGAQMMLAHDAAGFAAACVALLRDPDRCAALGNAARAMALDRFDNRRIIDNLMSFYQSEINRSQQ